MNLSKTTVLVVFAVLLPFLTLMNSCFTQPRIPDLCASYLVSCMCYHDRLSYERVCASSLVLLHALVYKQKVSLLTTCAYIEDCISSEDAMPPTHYFTNTVDKRTKV